MSQPPAGMSIQRILFVSLRAGAVVVIAQSVWLVVQLVIGYRGADPVVELTIGLVLGVVAWLCTAAVLVLKSSRRRA